MKQFLYLDNDIVASIIAQTEKGFITKITDQAGEDSSNELSNTLSGKAEGGINGGLFKLLQGNVSLGVEGQTRGSNLIQISSKEIVEKTLHDASFDIAYGYIEPNEADSNNDMAGSYIKLMRRFTFVDLNYLEGLGVKGGVIEYLKKANEERITNEAASLESGKNREQRRHGDSTTKTAIKSANKQLDIVPQLVNLLKGLVPYSRMLVSHDGYLIPLDDKYFRIDPANLGFKYGGEITCVGLVTNIIEKDIEPNEDDSFASLQFWANHVLRTILPAKDKDLFVVHPIAVYYGN